MEQRFDIGLNAKINDFADKFGITRIQDNSNLNNDTDVFEEFGNYLITSIMLEENFNDIQLEVLNYIDILIDGRFEIDKRDLSLKFRGSSNQRIIDVVKSLDRHETILYDLKNKQTNKKKEVLYI